ncbi:MAG: efflux RND transporter periplasmic adaptor subunit [Anaerolineaceae bacterium]|nr:efflux RND transporter periplasmic adaptor subunit [Anaerolineaceae bacterium]
MKKWVKTVLILAVILVVAAVVGIPLFMGYQARTQYEATAAAMSVVDVKVDDLVSTVGATGSVRANQTGRIVWQTSGVVESVLVDEGDPIQKGEKLAELESTSLSQVVINAQAERVNAQKALDNLLDSEAAIAAAQLELARAQIAYEDANEDRSSKNYQRVTQLTLDQLYADWLLAQNKLEDAEDYYSNFEDRAENDSVRLSAFSVLTAARKEEERARANYYYAIGGPDTNEISEADANLAVAEARLEDAQREWERVKDGPAADDILSAETRIEAAEAILKTAYLEASFAGTITDVSIKEGDSVNAGTIAFRVDDLSKLYVDVWVLEIDINSIEIGQTVEVAFDANPNYLYTGSVVEVSKVGEDMGGKVQFAVSIEILDPDSFVKPGMTADVTIITEQLSGVLMVPNQALVIEDGKTYVTVKRLTGDKKIEVTTGLSANSYTQILSGDLKEGDQVLLNLPTTGNTLFEMMREQNQGPFGGGD